MTHTFPPGSGQHGLPEHSDRDSSNLYKKHGALLTLKYNVPKIGSEVQFIHGAATLECCKPQSISVPVESENSSTEPAPVKVSKTRKASKKVEVQPLPLDQLKWLPLKQAPLRWPSFTEKALRHIIAQAEAYAKFPQSGLRSNGFIDCFVRPAGQRKIILNADRFDLWLKSFSVSAK